MANPLDTGLLEGFSVIFSMIFVFVVVYGIMSKTKMFGENHGLHALSGLVAGLFLLFAPKVNQVLVTMIPWFVLIIIFVVLIIQMYSAMGVREDTLLQQIKNNQTISTWFIILSFVILLGSLGAVFFSPDDSGSPAKFNSTSQEFTTKDVGTRGESAFFATIFHPKVLGMIMIMLIGVFTIMLIGD